MNPEGRGPTRVSVLWNGGHNGWASFIVGFGWMPSKLDWTLHIYLGLWILTLRGKR
jgi:hypothetical protein